MKIRNILILCFLVSASFFAKAQNEVISEDDVDLNIQKWFYSEYPKSSETIWSKVHSAAKKERYQVAFIFEGVKIIAIYNSEGQRISELKEVSSPHIHLVNFLEENYEKPKIKSLQLKTDFLANKTVYLLDVKSKNNGLETLHFDDRFNLLSNDYLTSSN